jgi:hypothetical protein
MLGPAVFVGIEWSTRKRRTGRQSDRNSGGVCRTKIAATPTGAVHRVVYHSIQTSPDGKSERSVLKEISQGVSPDICGLQAHSVCARSMETCDDMERTYPQRGYARSFGIVSWKL